MADAAHCDALGGSYQGDGTTCATTTCPVNIPSGHDCWFASTCAEATSSAEFGGLGAYPPIPADFFGPGSDPYVGTVPLGQGFTDTVMFRFDTMTLNPCDTVEFEMLQLSMAGCAPITVTYNGGQDPQQWDLTGLSVQVASLGSVTACSTHADGGRFDSTLLLNPKWEFTPRDGGESRHWLPPPIEMVATDGPFCHGPSCTDLPFCNPYYRPGYAMAPDGTPCCEAVCYRAPANPANSICLRPVAEGPCVQCSLAGVAVPAVSHWGLAAMALIILTAATSTLKRPRAA